MFLKACIIYTPFPPCTFTISISVTCFYMPISVDMDLAVIPIRTSINFWILVGHSMKCMFPSVELLGGGGVGGVGLIRWYTQGRVTPVLAKICKITFFSSTIMLTINWLIISCRMQPNYVELSLHTIKLCSRKKTAGTWRWYIVMPISSCHAHCMGDGPSCTFCTFFFKCHVLQQCWWSKALSCSLSSSGEADFSKTTNLHAVLISNISFSKRWPIPHSNSTGYISIF